MTNGYNQTLREDTKYSCTVYTFLHLILLDYAVEIKQDKMISFIYYLEKLGVLVLNQGAVFSIIYLAMAKYINIKYGINIKVETASITAGLNYGVAYGLGLKKLTSNGQKLGTIDGAFTNEDVDTAMSYKGGYGHNHTYKNGYIIDSWNTGSKTDSAIRYSITGRTLQYGVKKDLYYDTARWIKPGDSFTNRLKEKLIDKAKISGRPATLQEFEYILKQMKGNV